MDTRSRGITRRRAASAAIAAPVLAQTQLKTPGLPEAALTQVRQNSEALRKFRTPLLLEPSFTFRA